MEGSRQDSRGQGEPSYMPTIDPGRHGGGTYTAQATEPTLSDYENVFGPSARDIKSDLQRYKRHGRWHLPDALKGPNQWLTDRVDGLITDATNSPFTTKILPYKYLANPDAKLKWNVWSFDEGMASRVPYESAARTLTQTKRSFAGYTVRQGLAIVLEHNFMMSEKGKENFRNQLQQLVGSIQYTNDLDVHVALVLAPSYQKTIRERYYVDDKTPTQVCREFVDLFGFMQKNTNALDILIEEAKAQLKSWGGPMPDFLLCNSKLTFQLTMLPEKTNYLTQGIDGVKRLRAGPDISSYRGLSIVHSRSFSMDPGTQPRDILRRRVRVAEYYRILPNKNNINRQFQFYDEERDTWFTYSFKELLGMARYNPQSGATVPNHGSRNHDTIRDIYDNMHMHNISAEVEAPSHHLAPSSHHLAGQMEVEVPRPVGLGEQYLGMNVDTLTNHYDQNMVGKVAAAALNSSCSNWNPGGEFISEDIFFVPGAINWNHFYVKNQKQYPPLDPAVDPTKTAAWRASPQGAACIQEHARALVAVAADATVARNVGDIVYIPPEKYYFPSIFSNDVDGQFEDYERRNDDRPYGVSECSVIRQEMLTSANAFAVSEMTAATSRYAGSDIVNFTPAVGADRIKCAMQEQAKVTMSILFQAFCEYPRNMTEFHTPIADAMPPRALAAEFRFGSDADADYQTSVRFRNYMRYGVAEGLLATQIPNHADNALEAFNYPVQCMRRNNVMFAWDRDKAIGGGGGVMEHLSNTFLTWNKVNSNSNSDPSARDVRDWRGVHYSAFDITHGNRSRILDAIIPGAHPGAAGAPILRRWKSKTVFEDSLDNGLAFLREPGAFLSPNHFHASNDAYNYESVGSFLGSHIILTYDMLEAFLRHNTHTGPLAPVAVPPAVPAGLVNAFAAAAAKTEPFLEQTLLLDMITNNHRISDARINQLFVIMQNAWRYISTPTADSPSGGGLGTAAPAAGAPPVPAPTHTPRASRINLTHRFVQQAGVLSANQNLSTFLRELAAEMGYNKGHNRLSSVWTWPHAKESREELWCQQDSDYRVVEYLPAVTAAYNILAAALQVVVPAGVPIPSPDGIAAFAAGYVADPAVLAAMPAFAAAYMPGGVVAGAGAQTQVLPAAAIGDMFPAFQVGDNAIRHWWKYADHFADVVAPMETLRANAPPVNPALGPHPLVAADQVTVYNAQTWAFGRNLLHPLPRQDRRNMANPRAEVLAFLFQIHSRLVCDQSEAPFIHEGTGQFHQIRSVSPVPYRLPKINMPCFQGRPGGMFHGLIGDLGPQEGGPRAAWPHNWPGPSAGGPAWPHGPHWQGGHPRGPGGPGGPGGGQGPRGQTFDSEGVELVIVRPNIEHHMLGIIMGQGGEGLGNTMWGQTELSCYDDSMHGIWGMSYKYHERAMVFNEKNLVRLWDVAYDGYCGGKDSSYVKWTDPNEVKRLNEASNDVTRTFTGPSMMVMAFSHDTKAPSFDQFKRNWPSPIVFHDDFDYDDTDPARYQAQFSAPANGDHTLAADPNNVHVLNFKDMRVFNNQLYGAYRHYFKMMPNFSALHSIRKPAGAGAVENDTSCDSMAFQGTMNVMEDGKVVDQVLGSGHHGPDYIGVSSIRSGKGYKVGGQPHLNRLV